MTRRLFVFGYGYVGRAFARRLAGEGWAVAATARSPEAAAAIGADGAHPVDPADRAAMIAALTGVSAVLVTAAPDAGGCPGLQAIVPALAAAGAYPDWLGYLSSTGVYGDRAGGWVDERSALCARSVEGARRVAAERDWAEVGRGMGLTVCAFRLPGIYGPGRSALDRVRSGAARAVDAPGQVFSRIHLDDLVAGLAASLARPRPGAAYNLCDDLPTPPAEVLDHAAALLRLPPPPRVARDSLTPAAQRFYGESKRVSNARAKAELAWRPQHPTYREGLAALLAEAR